VQAKRTKSVNRNLIEEENRKQELKTKLIIKQEYKTE